MQILRLHKLQAPHLEATEVPNGRRCQTEMRPCFDFPSSSSNLALKTATDTQ
jgi:hypothetical protein